MARMQEENLLAILGKETHHGLETRGPVSQTAKDSRMLGQILLDIL